MRILVGCEESQAVCKAFRAKGHEAYSCDLQPCSGGHPEWHIQGDVLKVIKEGWDMAIFHPPCQYLSNAGIGYYNIDRYGRKAVKRLQARQRAADFFMKLYYSRIDKIAIENPVGYINNFLRPAQIIQPYYFGDADSKRTCLWLKNLQPLVHTKHATLFETSVTHVQKPEPIYIDRGGHARYFTDAIGPAQKRSKTFPGIAQAMAEQWG